MRFERIEEMERYITTNNSASLDELCEVFNVSKNTVRRDLKEILSRGEFKKAYGGVYLAHSRLPLPFKERLNKNVEVKQRIARRAAQEVKSGDIIYIDSGTTTCNIVDSIGDISDVTVLTHSLEVVNRALNYTNLTVISLPGALNFKTLSFICSKPSENLNNYNIGKAFMASDGITAQNGATQSTTAEFEIKRAVVSRSSKIYLLAEQEKFDQVSLYTYCNISQFDSIFTDVEPSKDFCEAVEAAGGNVIIA